ncbi:hypothetical protein LCGC14_0467260 [marine sediment metagenome]|uniref:Glycosyl transferase family 1 domain-containing protein n=1 Tax=marine sediment metagenome TaxID=412755 RepID=A0A0F9VM75_9ZZZZ
MDNTGEELMKIQIVNQFHMQWIRGYNKVFHDCEVKWTETPQHDNSDVMIFMWMDDKTRDFINNNEKQCTYVVFCRRYEIFTYDPASFDWSKVDKVIFVNDYLAEIFREHTGVTPEVVYNGVNPDIWSFEKRGHGKKVAWVGFVNQKKNLPLALQIMSKLPKDYELHIAGEIQCSATMDYLQVIAGSLGVKVILSGHVKDMDTWLEYKNYLLSTAISEGNPNNVIEAMAKGIKPVVHNWPGARQQFEGYTFNSVDEAVAMMSSESEYNSSAYLDMVNIKFGWNQYVTVRRIVDKLKSEVLCEQG